MPHVPGMPIDSDAADTGMIFLMHGPQHARVRGLLAGALSARRVAALRLAVEQLAAARLGELIAAGPPADLVETYARPLAIGTLSELLGIPIADRPGFAQCAETLTALFGMSDAENLAGTGEQLAEFISDLVAERRAAPGDDLVSTLLHARATDDTTPTDAELHGLVFSLLAAGYLPPAQTLTLGVLRLLLDPRLAATLRSDPDLLPTAADELLRLDPAGAGSTDRALRATEDLEIHGHSVRHGEIVIAPLGAANRDPRRFTEPDRLDPTRTPNSHLSFAPGPHHCLGAALVRIQLQAGLATLLDGLPTLTLAEATEHLEWQTGLGGTRNLTALPVHW